jgi:group I intron endonuclease
MATIYILENKINKKCYIGQTINLFEQRFNQHIKSNFLIGKAIRKYGIDNFKKILIEDVPEEKLNELEIEYIQKYNSVYPNGYNLTFGGDSGKKSEETKRRISEAKKGRRHSEETKIKISDAGKRRRHSEENKKKISESEKGKFVSEETKRKMSKAKKNFWENKHE